MKVKALTVNDFAERMSVSSDTIYRMLRNKKIEGARKFGGVWRFSPELPDRILMGGTKYEAL